MTRFRVARAEAVTEGEAHAVTVEGHEIVLCRVEGRVCALSGICTHEDLPLAGGPVEDGVLTCPWHGARYEVRTGRVLALPALRPLRVYPVDVDGDGAVHVEIDD